MAPPSPLPPHRLICSDERGAASASLNVRKVVEVKCERDSRKKTKFIFKVMSPLKEKGSQVFKFWAFKTLLYKRCESENLLEVMVYV